MYFKAEHSPPPACYPWRLYAGMVSMETVDKLQMFFTASDKSHLHGFSTSGPQTSSVGSQPPGHHLSPPRLVALQLLLRSRASPLHIHLPLKTKNNNPKTQQAKTKQNKAPKHFCSFTFLQSIATYYSPRFQLLFLRSVTCTLSHPKCFQPVTDRFY